MFLLPVVVVVVAFVVLVSVWFQKWKKRRRTSCCFLILSSRQYIFLLEIVGDHVESRGEGKGEKLMRLRLNRPTVVRGYMCVFVYRGGTSTFLGNEGKSSLEERRGAFSSVIQTNAFS